MNKNTKRLKAILKDHNHDKETRGTKCVVKVPARDYSRTMKEGRHGSPTERSFVNRTLN